MKWMHISYYITHNSEPGRFIIGTHVHVAYILLFLFSHTRLYHEHTHTHTHLPLNTIPNHINYLIQYNARENTIWIIHDTELVL